MTTAEDTPNPARKLRTLWANPQMRYPVLMIAYLLVGGSLFSFVLSEFPEAVETLDRFTALCVHKFVGVFTDLTTQRDAIVTLDGFAVLVIIECVGLLEMVIYSACVLAFPAPVRAKLWGIPLGCAAIFGFNVLRIATLLVVGRHWSEYFDFFHVYFWQATLIAMIVSVLYGWIKLFVHR
jgi:archaeosortase B (VPXXXP-CTERM-specific)